MERTRCTPQGQLYSNYSLSYFWLEFLNTKFTPIAEERRAVLLQFHLLILKFKYGEEIMYTKLLFACLIEYAEES